MKKLVLLIGSVFMLTACNDDDGNSSNSIVGDWSPEKSEIISGKDKTTILDVDIPSICEKNNVAGIKPDGIFETLLYDLNQSGECVMSEKITGTYTYDEQTKVFINKVEGEEAKVYGVLELTSTNLKIQDLNGEDYDRDGVNDIEIIYMKRK